MSIATHVGVIVKNQSLSLVTTYQRIYYVLSASNLLVVFPNYLFTLKMGTIRSIRNTFSLATFVVQFVTTNHTSRMQFTLIHSRLKLQVMLLTGAAHQNLFIIMCGPQKKVEYSCFATIESGMLPFQQTRHFKSVKNSPQGSQGTTNRG